MTKAFGLLVVAIGLMGAQFTSAQTPPTGTTGQCKDGTYSTAASRDGACRGHQGVKMWYAASATAATGSSVTPATAPGAKPSPAVRAAARTQAAGGGPGLVWVNSSTKVYHCYGTDFYGKTKSGAYMSEAEAKAKGAHADHGKACK